MEFRNLSDYEKWQHCPGNMDPADIPSRGMNRVKLANSALWWNGPDFLRLPEQQEQMYFHLMKLQKLK